MSFFGLMRLGWNLLSRDLDHVRLLVSIVDWLGYRAEWSTLIMERALRGRNLGDCLGVPGRLKPRELLVSLFGLEVSSSESSGEFDP